MAAGLANASTAAMPQEIRSRRCMDRPEKFTISCHAVEALPCGARHANKKGHRSALFFDRYQAAFSLPPVAATSPGTSIAARSVVAYGSYGMAARSRKTRSAVKVTSEVEP